MVDGIRMSVLIKICGLKTPDGLEVALEAGADLVGFVFFSPSPRHVGYEAARVLGAQVRGRALKVALSVDADDRELAAGIEALAPDLLQLHGREMPERVAAVRARFGLPVMKALPIAARADLAAIRLYDEVADRLIFDARAPREATRPGGLGRSFDWRLLENLDVGVPFLLSGGLDAGNVAEALRITAAPGVDVSSGVERSPGDKDPDRIRAFVRAARAATGRAGHDEPNREQRMTVQRPNSFRTGPDERGHFGLYGGRFVAETLMPLILDLERAYAEAKNDPAFQAEMNGHLARLRRSADAALFRGAHDGASRRCEDLPQARGPQPHRRAQGEQRAGPDPAGAPHAQAARHRRNRRRHARSCDCDHVCEIRARMRGLHGLGRRRAAAAERAAHEGAGRRGASGRVRARGRSRTR